MGGPKRGMYTLCHTYIFRNVSIFAKAMALSGQRINSHMQSNL